MCCQEKVDNTFKWPTVFMFLGPRGNWVFAGKTASGFLFTLLCGNQDKEYYSHVTEDKAEAKRGDRTCLSLCSRAMLARRGSHSPPVPAYLDILHEPVALPAAGEGLACGCQG